MRAFGRGDTLVQRLSCAHVIDLHCHILPGLDDGARSISEARDLARAAAADGITAIAATPHVRDDYPTTAEQMERGVAELRRDLAAQGIPVRILHGGEVALDRLGRLGHDELRRFTLAQSGRYLLVEFPYYGWPLSLEYEVGKLRAAGLTAILAHPERNAEVQEAGKRLRAVVDSGALVQVTAASLDGRLGKASQRSARELIKLGLVHLIASDAHAPALRAVGMTVAARVLRDSDLARYLTLGVPERIIRGETLAAYAGSAG